MKQRRTKQHNGTVDISYHIKRWTLVVPSVVSEFVKGGIRFYNTSDGKVYDADIYDAKLKAPKLKIINEKRWTQIAKRQRWQNA